ncbi:MAG: HlyC/CorC family transporter [Parachlamydiaceae bacterium]|nr:HlyC/CorC family transporter [Parachlamydiaceae bacterium]
MDISFSLSFIVFLTFCSGFFSASEAALFSLPSTRIKAYQFNKDFRKKLISNLVLKPRDLLVTVFMLNTLVNILLQNTISHFFGHAANWLFKVGIPFVIMLLFGEIIPKYIGLKNNIELSQAVAPIINFFQNILSPLRKIIINITVPVSHTLFFFLRKEKDISKEELKHVLKTSQEHGVLHSDEAELVWGYLNLQEASVKELMRPRDDILSYDINEPITKLIHLFIDQECSKIPVCDQSLENIIGIVNAQEFFLNRQNISTGKQLEKILTKPLYIPETTPAQILLRRFDEQNQLLALVVDEYGSISGLITREDLVEMVIGKISDRRDTKDLYTKAGNNEIITSGRLELSELNELFDVDLSSENNMITIGGWLTEQFGDIPKTGTKVEIGKLLFHVLAAEPNKIHRLYIRKLDHKQLKKTHPQT